MAEKANPLFVGSIEKGVLVLDAFYNAGQYLRFSDLVLITGLSKSAVQRYVYTWEKLGFLKKNQQTRQYSLTAKSLDVAYSYLRSSPMIEMAVPHLVEARNRCGQTVNLSFLDDTELIYVFRAPNQLHNLNSSIIGRRIPLYCSAGGRAILSKLPDEDIKAIISKSDLKKWTPHTQTDPVKLFELVMETRDKGYSIIVQETLLGEITVAAPVISHQFDGLAAVHIPVMMRDWTKDRVEKELAPEVVKTARIISGL